MRRRKGFTLIELLVVIAVIGLLLAIVLPAFRKAKQKALEVVCRSNLHQWGLLFTMYTQPGWRANYYRKTTVNNTSQIPLMLGGMWDGTHPLETDAPPPLRGVQLSGSNMSVFCVDRHNGGPNVLFLDLDVRKVGLKRLWGLKWHRNWETGGRSDWTNCWFADYPDE